MPYRLVRGRPDVSTGRLQVSIPLAAVIQQCLQGYHHGPYELWNMWPRYRFISVTCLPVRSRLECLVAYTPPSSARPATYVEWVSARPTRARVRLVTVRVRSAKCYQLDPRAFAIRGSLVSVLATRVV